VIIILNILSICRVVLVSAVLAFSFICTGYAMDVTLEWDANIEPDLAGYKVYYDTDSGHPYDGSGATEGDSPIDVGNVTEFTLHSLSDTQLYFLVVTAYDTEGLESYYSNEVTTGSEPSAGVGDGGGCFIATAAHGSDMDRHVD